MEKKKLFILGSSSIIGESVIRFIRNIPVVEYMASSTNQKFIDQNCSPEIFFLDPFNKKELKNVLYDFKPDYIINTCSLSDIAKCEENKTLANQLNTQLVELLCRICRITEAHLITLSSDYLFDFHKSPYSENDLPNPRTYFGKTKLAGENICISSLKNYTIIRLTDVFGYSSVGKYDFIKRIMKNLESKQETTLSVNYTFNPVFAEDAARIILRIIDKKRTGIYHIACKDILSEFEIGILVARVFGLDEDFIRSNDDNSKKISRGFVTLKAETDLGIKMSTIENALMALKHFEYRKAISTVK